MTTYPISAPPVTPSTETIGLNQKYNFMQSPYSGTQQTTTLGWTQWEITLGFPPVTKANAKLFMAWVDSLQGLQGSFTYQPQGSGVTLTGKTLNAAANAGTTSINVGGWTASQATGLTGGEYVTIGTQMFRVTSAPTNANASGVATLGIAPAVRATIAVSTACNFQTPTVTLRVSPGQNTFPALSRDPDSYNLPTLTCVEAH